MRRRELRARPVVVLGAARSGTKIFRDTVALLPGVAKVPYDINYVWRMGNEGADSDELPAEAASPLISARIQSQLARYADSHSMLVEKTVSNCLRVPFVHKVLPGAVFIHLIRDGRDVVESVERQWSEKPDWHYLAWKMRTYPLMQAPGYAAGYVSATIRRQLGRATAETVWGPRYAGMDDDVAAGDIRAVCARQWVRCLESALDGLADIPRQHVMTVRYEQFATSPAAEIDRVARFLGLDGCRGMEDILRSEVTSANIGRATSGQGPGIQGRPLEILQPMLDVLGYSNVS